MRIIFCGSGSFAVPSLQALLGGSHEIVMVVTQPSRSAGRGGRLTATPVAMACQAAGREAWQCEDANDPAAVEKIKAAGADVMAVADFGQFIQAPARAAVRVDAINLHGSLLP